MNWRQTMWVNDLFKLERGGKFLAVKIQYIQEAIQIQSQSVAAKDTEEYK